MNWMDILFDNELDDEATDSSWIDLDLSKEDTEEESTKVNVEDNETSETTEEPSQTDKGTKEESDEEIDLDALFAEIDDANEAIENIESNKWWDNTEDIWVLKDSLSKMEWIVKRLTNEKADLTYRVAEMEAFGWDSTDPKILLLSRNLAKANDWDDKAKTKTISLLKDMLYNLTWEDYEQDKINKDADILSAVEQYNTTTNPNLKTSKKENNDTLDIY